MGVDNGLPRTEVCSKGWTGMIGKHVAYGQRIGDTPQAIDEQTHEYGAAASSGSV